MNSSLEHAALLCAAMLVFAAPATAGDAAPLPVPRPPGLGPAQEAAPPSGDAAEVPMPPARPAELDHAQPPQISAGANQDQAPGSCFERLLKLGLRADPAPAIRNGHCGAESPLTLSRLSDGLEVSPPAVVTCPVAEALARWALEAVSAEADRLVGEAPTKILIGTSYECRGRNRQAGAKLSEHAFANAVDVMGFEFRTRSAITIAPRADQSPDALFQAAIRAKACAYFTTVLGPGSDAAHANHLHLDLRARRATSRICQ